MAKLLNDSSFYCVNCGRKGIPILRDKSKVRASGHMKRLWCPYCKLEIDHIELKTPFEIEQFKNDFEAGAYKEFAEESINFCKGN